MKETSKNTIVNFIQDAEEVIKQASKFVIEQDQSTIEAYLEKKSPDIDKAVISLESTNIGTYVTGEVSLILAEEDNFYLEGVFYFKKSAGPWITKKITGKKIPLSWEFTPDEQARLRSEKKITFEHEK